jgi:hypothetical protein
MCVGRSGFVVVARCCGRATRRILRHCWRGFRRARARIEMSQTHRAPQLSRITQRTPTPPTGGGGRALRRGARSRKPSRARTRCSTRPRRMRLACGAISKAEGRALRGAVLRGTRGRGTDAGAGVEVNGDGAHAIRLRLRKRRKGPFRGGGYVPEPVGALGEPDGVKVKRIIEDEDSGSCRFHLIVDTTTSHSLTIINIQYHIIRRNV